MRAVRAFVVVASSLLPLLATSVASACPADAARAVEVLAAREPTELRVPKNGGIVLLARGLWSRDAPFPATVVVSGDGGAVAGKLRVLYTTDDGRAYAQWAPDAGTLAVGPIHVTLLPTFGGDPQLFDFTVEDRLLVEPVPRAATLGEVTRVVAADPESPIVTCPNSFKDCASAPALRQKVHGAASVHVSLPVVADADAIYSYSTIHMYRSDGTRKLDAEDLDGVDATGADYVYAGTFPSYCASVTTFSVTGNKVEGKEVCVSAKIDPSVTDEEASKNPALTCAPFGGDGSQGFTAGDSFEGPDTPSPSEESSGCSVSRGGRTSTAGLFALGVACAVVATRRRARRDERARRDLLRCPSDPR